MKGNDNLFTSFTEYFRHLHLENHFVVELNHRLVHFAQFPEQF